MEKAIERCSFVAVVVFVCLVLISQGYGAIDWWGDVDPPDPSTWTSGTHAYIGKDADGGISVTEGDDIEAFKAYLGYESGVIGSAVIDGAGSSWSCYWYLSVAGTLEITNGGTVSCDDDGYIGRCSGSKGEVSVNGAGSSWSCGGNLYVGYSGRGTLDISNGGNVSVTDDTRVASQEGSTGQINFDNGTLTTGGLLAAPTDLQGAGVINTHGIVSDIDLIFDSTHGTNQTIILNSLPGQNITINLSQGSDNPLGAGYASEGTLTIKDGVSVESNYGILGWKSGSTGQATVDGEGSSWSCDWALFVGGSGQGTLEISNGGNVNCEIGYIGGSWWSSGGTGTVSVDGEGSSLSCSGYDAGLYIGHYGQGMLNITNGGLVKVGGGLTVDYDGDGDSFIRMATGGMLALYGDADDNNDDNITIDEFLAMVEGTDEIEYWDGTGWSNITNATAGEDYSIEYHNDGDLAGYTVLTVPEPATLMLLLVGLGFGGIRRRK